MTDIDDEGKKKLGEALGELIARRKRALGKERFCALINIVPRDAVYPGNVYVIEEERIATFGPKALDHFKIEPKE